MTILLADSFLDGAHDAKWDAVTAVTTANTTSSRHASDTLTPTRWASNSGGSDEYLSKTIDPPLNTVAAGVASWRQYSFYSTLHTIRVRRGGVDLVRLGRVTGGTADLQLTDGAGTTLGTYTNPDGGDGQTWVSHSLVVVIDGAQSRAIAYLGDTPAMDVTLDLGTGGIDEVQISTSAQTTSADVAFQDAWITDGEVLGDARVEVLVPSGVGAAAEWTPDEGVNWARVADASVGYVETDTVGYRDSHVHAGLDDDGRDRVLQVAATVLAYTTDLTAREVAPSVRIGGVDYDGLAQALTAAPSPIVEVWDVSPATSAAWTAVEVDGAEFGYGAAS